MNTHKNNREVKLPEAFAELEGEFKKQMLFAKQMGVEDEYAFAAGALIAYAAIRMSKISMENNENN